MGWEHHCDKEDFVELTRKYDERKSLIIVDNIDQLQEFIAAAHGRFPRQFVIHPDMSEEQMKENQLHHFWDKRTRWEHHCNKEDFVELKRMWNSKKRTSTTNMNNLKQLREFIAAAHGSFPQFVIHPNMSEEQKKEKQLFHFWLNRKQWEHHCNKEDFVELTRMWKNKKKNKVEGQESSKAEAINLPLYE